MNRCLGVNARDHSTIPPNPLVGTVCSVLIRPTLRGGVAAGTASALLLNVSLSPNTLAFRLL